MKAVLEFDLPEEREELEMSLTAYRYYNVLCDLDNWLRGEIKYNGKNEYEDVREMLHTMLDEENLEIN
jgi:hypothetical protein